jgi:polyhydroxybutyrate depolymerase
VIEGFRAAWAWVERLRSRRLRAEAIRHDGVVRSYLLYLPRHLAARSALPLVLVFHGGAGTPKVIAQTSRMHQIAEREGFIVVYPAGTRGRGPWGLTWNAGVQPPPNAADDVGFVGALIEELQRRYSIDPARIYAAGMSIGGSLVYQLACAHSDRLAAVAVVAGTMTADACDPVRPVALLHIHGTADQRVPLQGGQGRFTAVHNYWPPVFQGIERWCGINRCSGPAQVIRLVEGLIGRRFTGDADVELWLVEGGRHVWPGVAVRGWWWWGRMPRRGFSASEKVWNFFAAHPRAGKFGDAGS